MKNLKMGMKRTKGLRWLLGIVPAGMLLAGLAAASLPSPVMADAYWDQRVSLFDTLPVFPEDIVFLGNSITDGGEFTELLGLPNAKNRGIRSDVIDGVRKRLHQVTSGQPAQIFLLIGINDISHHLGAREIASRYRTLVSEIRSQSPSTELVIQSIMPINNSFGRYRNLKGTEGEIVRTNELLRQIAQEEGARFLDLTETLSDSKGRLRKEFTNDGLHLTGKGYKAWAEALAPYVKNRSTDAEQTDTGSRIETESTVRK